MASLSAFQRNIYLWPVANLAFIAMTLFGASDFANENNWKMVTFFALVTGWILIINYLFRLPQQLLKGSGDEQKIFFALVFLGLAIVAYLGFGTHSFFTDKELQTLTGQCSIEISLGKQNRPVRYELFITQKPRWKSYDITRKQFDEFINEKYVNKQLVEHQRYPCKKSEVTIKTVPHWGYIVSME